MFKNKQENGCLSVKSTVQIINSAPKHLYFCKIAHEKRMCFEVQKSVRKLSIGILHVRNQIKKTVFTLNTVHSLCDLKIFE